MSANDELCLRAKQMRREPAHNDLCSDQLEIAFPKYPSRSARGGPFYIGREPVSVFPLAEREGYFDLPRDGVHGIALLASTVGS